MVYSIKVVSILIFCCLILTSYFIHYYRIYYYSSTTTLLPTVRKIFVANKSILIHASARITQSYNCTLRGDKWIIITTIFHPTLAIRKFLLLSTPWNLIVIGDRKTPQDWISNITDRSRLVYLSIDEQLKLDFKLIDYLPEKSYARKNIGYLVAIQCGA
ncbi:unnamed protein product, partial [Didymodactylos carnosus]